MSHQSHGRPGVPANSLPLLWQLCKPVESPIEGAMPAPPVCATIGSRLGHVLWRVGRGRNEPPQTTSHPLPRRGPPAWRVRVAPRARDNVLTLRWRARLNAAPSSLVVLWVGFPSRRRSPNEKWKPIGNHHQTSDRRPRWGIPTSRSRNRNIRGHPASCLATDPGRHILQSPPMPAKDPSLRTGCAVVATRVEWEATPAGAHSEGGEAGGGGATRERGRHEAQGGSPSTWDMW